MNRINHTLRRAGMAVLNAITEEIPDPSVGIGALALAGYFESLSNQLESGDITREEAWFWVLRDHPYISPKEREQLVKGEYCANCGTNLTDEPDGSTLCSDCFHGPESDLDAGLLSSEV